ncbi:efflux RND transporter periplasmic adaptor subunit [Saprospira sp. CCB-QB6]|uniref:efflux RND transporter periplasmic adaptor subunit n=1 Tax=Saprospira sp. CCB-QB6 TaxID=3023936 RepID=UPI002349AC3E|nr:efflux RND transporter periplasmic adaptor subunit [Saprospira sp. CCB-QB6]WCL79963.1 efflux RND transporter periplasmic adaptor subunit [Saprospira sp. CCB-QB6]
MKSVYPFLLVASLILSLSACGTEEKKAAEEQTASPKSPYIVWTDAQLKQSKLEWGQAQEHELENSIKLGAYSRLPEGAKASLSVELPGKLLSIRKQEGQYVQKGEAILQIESLGYQQLLLEKSQLERQIAEAEQALFYLEKALQRQEALAKEQINSGKALEQAQLEVNKAKASLDGMKKELNIRQNQLNQFSSAQAGHYWLQAPISGYISELNLSLGQSLSAGQPLLSIVDNKKMQAELEVFEKDWPLLEEDQKVELSLAGPMGKRALSAKVLRLGQAFGANKKSISVRLALDSLPFNLVEGLYMDAKLHLGHQKALVLPATAVYQLGEQAYFYALAKTENGQYFFEALPLVDAQQYDDFYYSPNISQQLKGRPVVLQGAYYLGASSNKEEGE